MISDRMKMDHRLKRRIRHLHKKHKLHHRTIFYMRKGRKLHFHGRIVRESLKIVIAASLISTLGGIGLQALQEKVIAIIPLLILLPALNHMAGSFGTVVSSRFATDLYLGRVSRSWWRSKSINNLLTSTMLLSFITALYTSVLVAALSLYKGFGIDAVLLSKIILITVTTTVIMVSTVFFLSVLSGLYLYSRKKDPNNFLIPLTTSVADLGSMLIYAVLIYMLL